METLRQLIRMSLQGESRRQMAVQLGISRNTVKKYLLLLEQSGHDFEALLEMDADCLEKLLSPPSDPESDRLVKLESLFPGMERELKRVGVTRWLLWEEYTRKHPGGYSYGRFCHYFQEWAKQSSVSMPQEHKAGDKVFIDFTGKKLKVVDKESGEESEVEVFVGVLGASQLTYVEAVASQKKEDFLKAIRNMLEFFGGVPAAIVPDNLKSAVRRPDRYEPQINPDLAAFARHYGTAVLPARSYKPKDKSLAEGGVKLVYRRIYAPLRDKTFGSLAELNQAIRTELKKHNEKPFQHRDYSRVSLFEQIEASELSPLPDIIWEPRQHIRATVYTNSHIWLGADKHYYSVPYGSIGKKVEVFFYADKVEIYSGNRRIALHKRDRKAYKYTTNADHMPSTHKYRTDWNPERYLRWADSVGENTGKLINRIFSEKAHPEQAYKSCNGILRMAKNKEIGPERLEKACARALHFERHNYGFIRNVLKNRMEDIQPEIMDENKFQLPPHDNIRGKEYYS